MRFPLMFLAIVVGMPLLTAVWWWWADARLRRLPKGLSKTCWRWAVALFCLAFYAGYGGFLASRLGGWATGILPGTWWTAGVMVWGLLVLPVVVLPVLAVAGVWRGVGSLGRKSAAEPHGSEGVTRRDVLGAAVALSPMVLSLSATAISIPQKRRFRVRHLTVDVPRLPTALDGMSIAHLSDTHVGKFTRGEVLDRIVAATTAMQADLVLFTGDLIDFSLHDLPEALGMLSRIRRENRFFMIEGNHDLFEGREAFEREVCHAGMPLLLDEATTVRVRGVPVQLLGIRWHTRSPLPGSGIDTHVDRVAALRDPDAFPILLAHHPHAFDFAAAHDIPLTLAGHTHGGQLMLSDDIGAGPILFRYWSGLYRQRDARLVVSNGAGNWFPLRTYAPAEIIHLTLRRA